MITFVVDNLYTRVDGADMRLIKLIDKRTSYPVKNARFVKSFQKGRWDGKKHLVTHSKRLGYRFPTGVLRDVLVVLDNRRVEYSIVDNRRKHPKLKEELPWMFPHPLRRYQTKAVAAITRKSDLPVMRGKGLIRAPMRSGKTIIAAAAIHRIQRRALFITARSEIYHQTIRAYQETFGEENVGWIRGDEHIHRPVTIAMVQTLLKRLGDDKLWARLAKYGVVIFDEAHHLKAEKWREVVMRFDCVYKIGLSGTIYISHRRENEMAAIWLTAATGPIRYSISIKKLKRLGYLNEIDCKFYKVKKPDLQKLKWADGVRHLGIICNDHRNDLIGSLAMQSVAADRKCIIIAREHEHIMQICERLERGSYRVLFGNIPDEQRQMFIREFSDGEVNLLIGNVLGEGVDIPECDDVINAEGNRAREMTMQKLRNMTAVEGKKVGVFVDFIDDTNKSLFNHSVDRKKHMEREGAFDIEVVDVEPAEGVNRM